MIYIFKCQTFPITLFITILLFAPFKSKEQTTYKNDNEISFYVWKFKPTEDSSRYNLAGKKPVIGFIDFTLSYPLKKKFDSATFRITDSLGRSIEVRGFETIYIAHRRDPVILKSDGPQLSKKAATQLNLSHPGDSIIFTKIEAFEPATGKRLPNYSFTIKVE